MLTYSLVGNSGFVGSNLIEQTKFDNAYNSKNISAIIGQEIDVLVCAGVSAVKWVANQEPQTDIDNIEKLKQCLSQTKIKHLVLISTIDIYDTPLAVNEDNIPDFQKQDYYGRHRYQLEQWVAKQRNIKQYTIIRLPGLFGNHIKKNLVFDVMNPLAKSINKLLWQELKTKLSYSDINLIMQSYIEDDFGNLQQQPELTNAQKDLLVKAFANVGFSTLNFTDSRSSFQFYNLANLWNDIQKFAIEQQLEIVNLSSEPITAAELVANVTKQTFVNHTAKGPVSYDMYSKFAADGKYLYSKVEILEQINQLIVKNSK